MRATEFITEDVSMAELQAVERFADGLWKKLGINVDFSKHFLERVNDERNGKPISAAELVRIFKKEYERYGKKIADTENHEAVMKDLLTKINLPFVITDRYDHREMVAKTVMRKNNFLNSNPEYVVQEESELDEAQMSPDIKKIMTQKGYKYIAHGQDQDAYFAPDGSILKIFGWDREKGRSGFTKAQDSFIAFANYCRKNSSNPFLPDFSDWTPFEYKGQTYLQIKCERLFPLKGKWEDFGDELETFVDDYVTRYGVERGLSNYLTDIEQDGGYQSANSSQGNVLVTLLGEDGLRLFAQTISDLDKLANQNRFRLDLHSGNFMFSSDSHVVINDPFFTGSWRN